MQPAASHTDGLTRIDRISYGFGKINEPDSISSIFPNVAARDGVFGHVLCRPRVFTSRSFSEKRAANELNDFLKISQCA